MNRNTTNPIPFPSEVETVPTQDCEAGNVCTNGNASADSEPPVADFLEPVQYNWTEAGYEARQALRKFSEETHADY